MLRRGFLAVPGFILVWRTRPVMLTSTWPPPRRCLPNWDRPCVNDVGGPHRRTRSPQRLRPTGLKEDVLPMTPRERVLATINHQIPDGVPNGFEGFNRQAFELLRKRTGCSRLPRIFQADYRVPIADGCHADCSRHGCVRPPLESQKSVFGIPRGNLPQEGRVTEWGVGIIPGSTWRSTRLSRRSRACAHWRSLNLILCPTWTPITDGAVSRRMTAPTEPRLCDCRMDGEDRLGNSLGHPVFRRLPDGHGD